MRAFLAVVPPQEVVQDLQDFVEPRRRGGDPAGQWRWTRPEQLHLTLAFLPDLPARAEEPLAEEMAEWASHREPARLRLCRAGAFPDPAGARVLWLGVSAPPPAPEVLTDWARGIRARASRAGARVQGRAFRAHLTVARSRGGRPASGGRLVQALDGYLSPSWWADEVCLVASHLGQGPHGTPRYEVRHRWALSG
ncbi:RNA 2',3'-cyclic phosphodiesterase [Ornithinimicrobium sediminis]|uniref:RNA 2',3'-cyclic phosphodiesterase n=1 Tax=Ornithinimicrobium sediminis TaxID=2904603 RepID=UPI001E3A5D28|nr:RNA 2',3'-cyclic phosphodiesterase [Ornithinimicrobium sediminis]